MLKQKTTSNTLVVCMGCGRSYYVRTERAQDPEHPPGYCAMVQQRVGWFVPPTNGFGFDVKI